MQNEFEILYHFNGSEKPGTLYLKVDYEDDKGFDFNEIKSIHDALVARDYDSINKVYCTFSPEKFERLKTKCTENDTGWIFTDKNNRFKVTIKK